MKRYGPRKEVTLRLPVPLYRRVRSRVTGWHNSLNDQLVGLIEAGLAAQEQPAPTEPERTP